MMKEFTEKLIGRLEEEPVPSISVGKDYITNGNAMPKKRVVEIVNQLSEEHKDKTLIDGQYCWQTCSATEHCKDCNRLCNGSIDYYENYDVLAEERNTNFCDWRLCDEEANVYDTTCRNPHILIEGSPTDNNYEFCPYCGKKIKVVEPKRE